MYQDFGRSSNGFLKIDTNVIVSLVSRHLPAGALCTAVRLRAHDRLCLAVISDKREFWSREDDMRRARAITEDLRSMGIELPRLQWIRQSRTMPDPVYTERKIYGQPLFWTNVACACYACCALSWKEFAAYILLALSVRTFSRWLIAKGGWARLQRFLPFFKRGAQ